MLLDMCMLCVHRPREVKILFYVIFILNGRYHWRLWHSDDRFHAIASSVSEYGGPVGYVTYNECAKAALACMGEFCVPIVDETRRMQRRA
jgi:hypothetical protein